MMHRYGVILGFVASVCLLPMIFQTESSRCVYVDEGDCNQAISIYDIWQIAHLKPDRQHKRSFSKHSGLVSRDETITTSATTHLMRWQSLGCGVWCRTKTEDDASWRPNSTRFVQARALNTKSTKQRMSAE